MLGELTALISWAAVMTSVGVFKRRSLVGSHRSLEYSPQKRRKSYKTTSVVPSYVIL